MGKNDNRLTKMLHLPILLIALPYTFTGFMLPIYSKSLGASAMEIGGLFSMSAAVTLLLRPFAGWALDRFGRKPFFILALFMLSCSMFVYAFAGSLFRLYSASFIAGIGSLFMNISIFTIIADLSLPSERGKEMGKIYEQMARGGILGVFFGFFLYHLFPASSAWRFVFLCYAVTAIAALLLARRNVPETKPAILKHSHPNEKREVSKQLIKLMFIVFITGASGYMLTPIIMIFLQDKFTTEIGQLALVFLPGGLAVAFFASCFGHLSDRFGRIRLMLIGLILAGIFSIFIPYLSSLLWLAVLWLFFNIAQSMSGPAQSAMVSDIVGQERRGISYGLYDFSLNLGITLGPLAGGWLYDSIGKAMPFYFNGIVLLTGSGFLLIFMRQKIRSGGVIEH